MTFQEKQQQIKAAFAVCASIEEKYQKIMAMGRTLPHFEEKYKISEKLVKGCQSQLFLHCEINGDKLFFTAFSEALISTGLAYLLITVYSGETAESILKNPPSFLEEIGIPSLLTPSRANGLYSLHLKMKQEALACLVSNRPM